jgi:hypothetical protein
MTDPQRPIVVKFMAKKLRPETMPAWRRQLPDAEARWGRCQFVFDPDFREYDWLVAYDDLSPVGPEKFSIRTETLACAREHTILVTAEPSSIKCYSRDFCAQFGLVITHHEPWALHHSTRVYQQTGYPWFYGRGDSGLRSFDEIRANPPRDKTSLISTVCSAKQDPDTLQRQRFEFTARLQEALPEMDRFGKGIRLLDDKADVLDRYRYHVTIENDVAPHYFTEKLVDSFLGLSLPFYFGCPNAADYFPERSFIPIDIFDFEGALETIRNALAENAFDERLPDLEEARRRVLEKHNLFAVLAREIEARHSKPASTAGKGERILSRRALRNSGPLIFLRTVREKERLRRQVARRRKAAIAARNGQERT